MVSKSIGRTKERVNHPRTMLLERIGTMILIVLLAILAFRMVSRTGLWNDFPVEPSEVAKLPNAVLTIHCSKNFTLLQQKYSFPFERHVNCSSTHWMGRYLRNLVCQEVTRLIKTPLGDDTDDDKIISRPPPNDWVLKRLCTYLTTKYAVLWSGLLKLQRINGTWEGNSFDCKC